MIVQDYALLKAYVYDKDNWFLTKPKMHFAYVERPAIGTKEFNVLTRQYVTTTNQLPFLLKGTAGEPHIIGEYGLFNNWTLPDGSPISPELLKSKMKKRGKDYIIKPFKVRRAKCLGNTHFALHIPLWANNFNLSNADGSVIVANAFNVPLHGYGDFLICRINELGEPDLNMIYLENGDTFPDTYNMTNYREYGKGR